MHNLIKFILKTVHKTKNATENTVLLHFYLLGHKRAESNQCYVFAALVYFNVFITLVQPSCVLRRCSGWTFTADAVRKWLVGGCLVTVTATTETGVRS